MSVAITPEQERLRFRALLKKLVEALPPGYVVGVRDLWEADELSVATEEARRDRTAGHPAQRGERERAEWEKDARDMAKALQGGKSIRDYVPLEQRRREFWCFDLPVKGAEGQGSVRIEIENPRAIDIDSIAERLARLEVVPPREPAPTSEPAPFDAELFVADLLQGGDGLYPWGKDVQRAYKTWERDELLAFVKKRTAGLVRERPQSRH